MSDVYRIADFGPSDLLTSDVEGARRVKVSVNEQLFDGVKALTVQPFTEVNCKSGRQYEASFYTGDLQASSSADIVVIVGQQPITMKEISIEFTASLISCQWFRNPIYTGGTEIDVFNMNDQQAVAVDASVLGLVTTTNPGTPVGSEIYSIGSENQGNRAALNVSQRIGVERILWSNSIYLFRITNRNTLLSSKVSGLATWYQGPLSTNTPLEL